MGQIKTCNIYISEGYYDGLTSNKKSHTRFRFVPKS